MIKYQWICISVFFTDFQSPEFWGIKIMKFSIHQFLRAAGENFHYLCTSNTNHERFETSFDDFGTKMYEIFLIFPTNFRNFPQIRLKNPENSGKKR